MDLAYILVIVFIAGLFWWLYKRAVYDFTRGYQKGLEEGKRLTQKTKTPST